MNPFWRHSVKPSVEEQAVKRAERNSTAPVDLGSIEHVGAIAMGAALLAVGLTRKGMLGALAKIGGAALIARGASGYVPLYRRLGVAMPNCLTGASRRAVRVESAVEINRSASDLYALWRDVENLPAFMSHLISVQMIDPVRSAWTARGLGNTVIRWQAMIVNDIKNELIAWETVEGSSIDHAGSVHFDSLEDGKTRLRVVLRYDAPAQNFGAVLAKMLHIDPQRQIDEDLLRFQKMIDGLTKAQEKVQMM